MPHIHEKIDWCVAVYIVNGDAVLLRKHEKYHLWLGVGGHIELDETPLIAAKRESLEEVGLEVTIDDEETLRVFPQDDLRELPRPAGMHIHRINEAHEHIDVVYYATAANRTITPERDTDVWSWLTRADVETHTDLREDVREHALKALATFART